MIVFGREIKAVIFDLDGVIVSTDHLHYLAWKSIADEEGIPFDEKINDRLRGVSRMQSLEILLEKAGRAYDAFEKELLAHKKNELFVKSIGILKPSDILPGVSEILAHLQFLGVMVAIGSSSKNAKRILANIGMDGAFCAVADGNDITQTKPNPEIFLVAAKKLGVNPINCLVVEDADAGVEAAVCAGMAAVGLNTRPVAYDFFAGVKNVRELLTLFS